MHSQARSSFATLLEDALPAGASSQQVAALVTAAVRGIDQALAPVVGRRGVAALYKRSLHRCQLVHPWLPVAAEAAASEVDVSALSAALAGRTSAEALSAGSLLLESFRALLSTLIGESLTERLLRPVWATLSCGTTAQDSKS